jgi:hypothetical protein
MQFDTTTATRDELIERIKETEHTNRRLADIAAKVIYERDQLLHCMAARTACIVIRDGDHETLATLMNPPTKQPPMHTA